MRLQISKRYSCSFHPMSGKLYEDIGYHGRIQAITFLGNRLSFKNFVTLWNFTMRVNGKMLRCGISWKRLTRGPMVYICRVLFMLNCLSLVWGHSVHFAKFPILRFSKGYPFNRFHHISINLDTKYNNQGLIKPTTFFVICQKLQKLWHFEFFLNTGPYGAGCLKTLLLPQF